MSGNQTGFVTSGVDQIGPVQGPPFMHVVVDVTALQNQVLKLEEENKRLKNILDEKEKLLSKTVSKHQDELTSLRTLVDESKKSEALLQSKHEELLEKYGALKSENERLQKLVESLQNTVTVHEARIKELEARDHPITIREAMRILENHICLVVVGSKTKAKRTGLYNLDKLESSSRTDVKAAYKNFQSQRGFTEDHRNMLGYLKDNGDKATHDKRPLLTVDQFISLAEEASDDATDAKIKTELFNLLTSFVPKDTDQRLVLTPPLS